MLQKKPRIQPMSWSLITLLLAACGGGGGGGTPTTQNAVLLASGQRQIDVAEGSVRIDAQILTPAEQASAAPDLAIREITVNPDGLTGRIIYTSPHGDFAADVRMSGTDAQFFRFVQRGENGTHSTLEFRSPPDFERPQDYNGDNSYEIVIRASLSNNVPYYLFINRIPGFVIRVTDVTGDADPTPPPVAGGSLSSHTKIPAHAHEGDVIRIKIIEGNTKIFIDDNGNPGLGSHDTPQGGTFARGGLTGANASGPDADKVQTKTVTINGKQQTVIEFKHAPDFEAPTDVGNDNVYNFEFGGNSFEITVIDNPNEIL